MKVVNFGSLNVDHVYGVTHIVKPGETIATQSYARFAGGKGANQSVALARAGAHVWHAGMVGNDSIWLRERLASSGVNVDHVRVSTGPGGHAVIQVDAKGQNSIFLFAGANCEISAEHMEAVIDACDPGDFLLLQNEINATALLLDWAADAGMRVCLNPAPMTDSIKTMALEKLHLLVVNQHEGAELSGQTTPALILNTLADRYPRTALCLTLGEAGVAYRDAEQTLNCAAVPVVPVDTTAAGDCFIGFFLADMAAGSGVAPALEHAAKAAALSVTKPGAMDSIPTRSEVAAWQP